MRGMVVEARNLQYALPFRAPWPAPLTSQPEGERYKWWALLCSASTLCATG